MPYEYSGNSLFTFHQNNKVLFALENSLDTSVPNTFLSRTKTFPSRTNTFPSRANTFLSRTNTFLSRAKTFPSRTKTFLSRTNISPEQG